MPNLPNDCLAGLHTDFSTQEEAAANYMAVWNWLSGKFIGDQGLASTLMDPDVLSTIKTYKKFLDGMDLTKTFMSPSGKQLIGTLRHKLGYMETLGDVLTTKPWHAIVSFDDVDLIHDFLKYKSPSELFGTNFPFLPSQFQWNTFEAVTQKWVDQYADWQWAMSHWPDLHDDGNLFAPYDMQIKLGEILHPVDFNEIPWHAIEQSDIPDLWHIARLQEDGFDQASSDAIQAFKAKKSVPTMPSAPAPVVPPVPAPPPVPIPTPPTLGVDTFQVQVAGVHTPITNHQLVEALEKLKQSPGTSINPHLAKLGPTHPMHDWDWTPMTGAGPKKPQVLKYLQGLVDSMTTPEPTKVKFFVWKKDIGMQSHEMSQSKFQELLKMLKESKGPSIEKPMKGTEFGDLDLKKMKAMVNTGWDMSDQKGSLIKFMEQQLKIAVDTDAPEAIKPFSLADLLAGKVDPLAPTETLATPGDKFFIKGIDHDLHHPDGHSWHWTNDQLDEYIQNQGIDPFSISYSDKQEIAEAIIQKGEDDLHEALTNASFDVTFDAPPNLAPAPSPAPFSPAGPDVIDQIANSPLHVPDIPAEEKPKEYIWTLAEKQPKVGGYHPKIFLEDQDGAGWIFKPMDKLWRSDVEHGAHEAGRLFGFNMAESRVITWDGRTGLVQRMFINDGDFKNVAVETLDFQKWEGIAEHHVLEWLLDNDDAHWENFMVLKDGAVVGIDKGRAWRDLGLYPLKRRQLSSNADVYYEHLYRAMVGGHIPDADIDRIYATVIGRARAMVQVDDDAYRRVLLEAFTNRPENSYGGVSRDQFINQILDRKHGLVTDFEKFWDDMYKEMGRPKPQLRAPKLTTGDFSGLSPELFEDVRLSGSHGITTFYGGSDVEFGSELLWIEKNGAAEYVAGELKLRGEGIRKFQDWLNSHAKISHSGSGFGGGPSVPKVEVWHSDLADKITNGIKTVNTHAADGQYNTQKITGMLDARTKLEDMLKVLPEGEEREVVKGYLEAIQKAADAMDNKTKYQGGKFSGVIKKPPPTPSAPVVPATKIDVTHTGQSYQVKVVPRGGEKTLTTNPFDVDTGISDLAHAHSTKQVGTVMRFEVDGIEIEYGPESALLTQQGQLKFIIKNPGDDPSAQVEKVHDLLRQAGIDMTPATEDDLELLYFRVYLEDVSKRPEGQPKVGGRPAGIYHSVIQAADAVPRNLPPREQIDLIRRAMDTNDKWRQALEKAEPDFWHPEFNHESFSAPNLETGRPHFNRFDTSLKEFWQGIRKVFPSSSSTVGSPRDALVKSGGRLSTMERVRKLKLWSASLSPEADMGTGGADYVFTRLNVEHGHDIYFSPRTLLRTSTFSTNTDRCGALAGIDRDAPWDVSGFGHFTGGGNETMIKHNASILDDIEVMLFTWDSYGGRTQAQARKQLQETIRFLHSHNIFEIRGMKVEERFVMQEDRDAALKKAKQIFERNYL